jgi:hypothetical protein
VYSALGIRGWLWLEMSHNWYNTTCTCCCSSIKSNGASCYGQWSVLAMNYACCKTVYAGMSYAGMSLSKQKCFFFFLQNYPLSGFIHSKLQKYISFALKSLHHWLKRNIVFHHWLKKTSKSIIKHVNFEHIIITVTQVANDEINQNTCS